MKIKQRLELFIAVFMGLCTGICFAENSINCVNYFQKTDFNLMLNGEINVKNIVNNFCDSIIELKDCSYDSYFFDASQSVFLSVLCSNVGIQTGFLTIDEMTGENSLLKKYKFKEFDVYNYKAEDQNKKGRFDFCDYTTGDDRSLNNCDLSVFAPQIFDKIINDYFNIRQASNMGITELEDDFDKQKYANKYANNHFPGMEKLADKGICESVYYVKTCKYLKNYMSQVRNLLTTTEVINVKNLGQKGVNINCDSKFNENILYCGLLGDSDIPMNSLLKVIYNEYYWYNLFMSYYEYRLSYIVDPSSDINGKLTASMENVKTNTKNLNDVKSLNYIKVQKSQENVYRSKQAISMAINSLSKVEYALSMHVGFLMYQEDLKSFLDNLPKIYTPLRTLYDKLQNVQDANS